MSESSSGVNTGSTRGPLRAAIAGSGLMGGWHSEYARQCGAKVVGILDFDPLRARALADRFRTVPFENLDSLLKTALPDVLHVCTPRDSHVGIVSAALEAGVNVIVEKPLADSASQVEILNSLAQRQGVQICPVHQFAFQDGTSRAASWLPRIGSIILIQSAFISAGGGQLSGEHLDSLAADILPHPLAVMQKFLESGLPLESWNGLRVRPGEWHVWAKKELISLSILISLQARPTEASLRICGTQGTIHLDLFHGFAFFEPGNVSRLHKITHPFEQSMRRFTAASSNLVHRAFRREAAYPGLRRLICLFYKSIAGLTPPPITADESFAVSTVRDEIRDVILSKA